MKHLTGKWWLPIWLGIPLAVIAALESCWPVHGDLYFLIANHLYYLAGVQIIVPLDLAMAFILPPLFLLTVLFTLTGRLNVSAGRWARAVLAVLVAMLALSVILVFLHRHRYDRIMLMALTNAANTLIPKEYRLYLLPGGGGALLLIGISARHWAGALHRGIRWLAQPTRAAGRLGLHAVSVLGWLLLLGCAGINLITGINAMHAAKIRVQKPNVIFIMIDTVRADHMGCYGYRRNTTPNIDRFAGDCTLFSKAIAQAPWTVWSVYSFMTSQYPDTMMIGAPHDPAQIPTDDPQKRRYPMLAEVLKNQGYATHAVISNSVMLTYPEFTYGFDDYDLSPTACMNGSSSPFVTEGALRRLNCLQKGASFLYLLYADPHDPYIRHADHAFSDAKPGPVPAPISHAVNHTRQLPARCRTPAQETDAYDSEIAFTDHYVGQVLDALKAKGLYDSSLIILLSDHGEELREHGKLGHGDTLYDEVLTVPMMVKLPGQRRGAVIDGVFPLLDLMPSTLGALRLATPGLHPLGQDMDFAHLQRCTDQPIFSASMNGLLSIRTSGSKYIFVPALPAQELYRLLQDPWEQNNLAKKLPGEAARWEASLYKRRPPPLVFQYLHTKGTPFPSFTKEQLDQLRTLGYLQ